MRQSKPPKRDETGNRYGKLVVVEYAGRTARGMAQWLCQCDCGSTKTVVIGSLQTGVTKSCGCGMGYQFKDLAGQRFGMLTAVSFIEVKREHAVWLCRCDCGREKAVAANCLQRGSTKTCGCKPSRLTHGRAGTPEHVVWKAMIQRCTNPNNTYYADYGGRGITICSRWRGANGFANFLADMGPRPSLQHQIDRRNNSKGYMKSNCRWVVSKKNNRNRRDNRPLAFKGETRCLAEWAERIGVSSGTLWARLKKGWSVEKALTTPLREY